jgi:hypothetical protein
MVKSLETYRKLIWIMKNVYFKPFLWYVMKKDRVQSFQNSNRSKKIWQQGESDKKNKLMGEDKERYIPHIHITHTMMYCWRFVPWWGRSSLFFSFFIEIELLITCLEKSNLLLYLDQFSIVGKFYTYKSKILGI